MTVPASFPAQLKSVLPESAWSWVMTALRQDPLVWSSLRDPEFAELALQRLADRPSDWTPANLALLALAAKASPDFSQSGRGSGLVVSEALRQEAAEFYDHYLSESPTDLTLAQAGLLGIAFVERRRRSGNWTAVFADLPYERAWESGLACLFGLAADPVDMLRALVGDGSVERSEQVHLVLHALLSHPLVEAEQANILLAILLDLPPQGSLAILQALQVQRPALATDLARGLLETELPSHDAVSDNSTSLDASAEQSPAKLAGDLPKPSAFTSSPSLAAECVISSSQKAALHTLAGQARQAVEWRDQALSAAQMLHAAAIAGLAEAQALSGDLEAALVSWKGVRSRSANGPHPAESTPVPHGLLTALLEAGRPTDALALLPKQDTSSTFAYCLSAAHFYATQGEVARARQFARQALAEVPNTPDLHPATLEMLAKLLSTLALPAESARAAQLGLGLRPSDPSLLVVYAEAQRLSGDLAAAIEAAQLAVALAPLEAGLRRELAHCFETAGEWQSAYAERSNLLDSRFAPPTEQPWPLPEDLRALAACALHSGQAEQAIQVCTQALNRDPEDGLTHAILGEAYSACDQPDVAFEHYRLATQLAPHQARPWLALAEAQQASGQAEKAVETLQAATHAVPNDPLVHLALAEAHLAENAPTQALGRLQRAHQLLREQNQARYAAPHAPNSPDYEPGLSPRVSLCYGQTLAQLGHLEQSRQVLENAYREHPAYPGLAYACARILLSLDDSTAALAPLSIAVQSEPHDPAPYLDYGRTLLAVKVYPAGDVEQPDALEANEATRALSRALDLTSTEDPSGRALIQAYLAEALAASGEGESALQMYFQVLDTDLANDPRWRARLSFGLGRTALQINQPETAVAALQEAARSDPLDPLIQKTLSASYRQLYLPDEALEAARVALQLAPDEVDTLAWFAAQVEPLGAVPEAIQALQRATELAPNRTDLLIRLGQLLQQGGYLERAIQAYHSILKVEAPTAVDLDLAAGGLSELGDPAGAAACLKCVLDLLPAPDAALVNRLASAYRQLGEEELALEALDQALQLGPQDIDLHLTRSDLLLSLGRTQAAQAALEHALNLRPGERQIYARLAAILRSEGQLAAALEQAERMLAVGQDQPGAAPELAGRALAADLARGLLDPDLARSYLGLVNPAGNDDQAAQDLSFLCLAAELALEAGEEVECARVTTDAFEVSPEHPRVLALQSRLTLRRGDPALAAQALQNALQAVGQAAANQVERASGYQELIAREDQVASLAAVAEAAQELRQWETALTLLRQAASIAPHEPLWPLLLARVLVQRAEYQRLCDHLEACRHAPGVASRSEAAYQAFTEALQSVEGLLAQCSQGYPNGNHPLLHHWRTRAQAVFQTEQLDLQALQSLPPTAENIAALLAALEQAGDHQAILVLTQTIQDPAGEPNPAWEHPSTLAHLALALRSASESDPESEHLLSEAFLKARAVVDRQPLDPLSHALLARLAAEVGEVQTALQAIQTALSIWPDEPRWHAWAAGWLSNSHKPEKAIAHLEKAADLEPAHLPHQLSLAGAYLEANDPFSALQILEEARQQQPEQVEVHMALSQARLAGREFNRAAADAEQAISLAPGRPAPLLLRAQIALETGDARGALNRAQAALQIEPENAEALRILSAALRRLGRLSEALSVLQQAIPLAEDPLPLLLEKAALVESLQGPAAGLQALQELSAEYPGRPEVLAPLAKALAAIGQREASIQTAREALKSGNGNFKPADSSALHFLLGRLLRQSGQLDQAIAELDEALRLVPDDLEAALELGSVHQDRRQPVQALQTYQKAIAIAPNDHRPYYQAALAFKDNRDYAAAEKMLRRAAALAHDDLAIHRQLAAIVALNLVYNRRPAEVS